MSVLLFAKTPKWKHGSLFTNSYCTMSFITARNESVMCFLDPPVLFAVLLHPLCIETHYVHCVQFTWESACVCGCVYVCVRGVYKLAEQSVQPYIWLFTAKYEEIRFHINYLLPQPSFQIKSSCSHPSSSERGGEQHLRMNNNKNKLQLNPHFKPMFILFTISWATQSRGADLCFHVFWH